MDYWDTSALLKLYVLERDSDFFLDRIASASEPISTSAIASAEVLCALLRKEAAGDLKRGSATWIFRRFGADCRAGRIMLIPYGDDVMLEAEKLARAAYEGRRRIMVRSLDLIHVASALSAGARRMVATDKRLRSLAEASKLEVLP